MFGSEMEAQMEIYSINTNSSFDWLLLFINNIVCYFQITEDSKRNRIKTENLYKRSIK